MPPLPAVGSLHRNVRGLAPSATVALNERSAALAAEGRRVYRLGLGQSPFPVPPPVVEALRRNAPCKDYLAVRGLAALRQAVADYHRRATSVRYTAADVLVGPGSKELMFLLQVVFDGELLVPTPAWVSYAPQARIVGRRVRLLQTRAADRYRLAPDDLSAACAGPRRPRVLILNYPSNPTGQTYSGAELRALAAVARRHGVIVLSDEIYGELHYRGRHVSLARFLPEQTILASGISKWCGAGGWRLGTFAFPPSLRWLLDAMAAVASETYTSTSAPIQHAAVRAFEGGPEIARYLAAARRILEGLLGRAVARLAASGVAALPPAGAFYLYADFSAHAARLARRGIRTAAALCARLLDETGVAVLPASDFGRPPGELAARLALVNFGGERALAAARPGRALDDAFFERYCGPSLEAIEALCGWLDREPAPKVVRPRGAGRGAAPPPSSRRGRS